MQVTGKNAGANERFAKLILSRIRPIPGVADARIQQSSHYPQLNVNVDRSRLGQLGLTERDVTTSLASSLAGTAQTAPVYFLNPENGRLLPGRRADARTPDRIGQRSLPTCPSRAPPAARRRCWAASARSAAAHPPAVVSHYNIAPAVDIYGDAQRA